MSNEGSDFQLYKNELVMCSEEMCTKREEIHIQIIVEEEEKNKIQANIRTLVERLTKVTESLSKKYAVQNDYDKTIAESETAYLKIIESSQTIVHASRKEIAKESVVPKSES